jgi:hypothetical protein
MSQTLIMRDRSIVLTEPEKAGALKALRQLLRGIDEKNDKRWGRVVKGWFELEDGEITTIDTRHPRSGPFHRFHMVIEMAVFKAQEKFVHEDQFRNWLKIGAGHVDWAAGPKGGVVPLPKSISYADLEEPAMREFHDAMMAFLRGPHAAPYLWKHLGNKSHDMMATVLAEFER